MTDACNCDLFLYADDSALLMSHKDQVILENSLSEEVATVNSWLIDNKLSLHSGKTESILFGSKIN